MGKILRVWDWLFKSRSKKNSEIDRDYETGIFRESNDSYKGRYLDFEIKGIFIILKNQREFLPRKKNG